MLFLLMIQKRPSEKLNSLGVNSLFLTVGEKIRQARQQFNLKQGSFRNFGITQHYLSMIETNKRQARADAKGYL